MAGQQLYVIDYTLHGESRTFIIRLEKMDNAVAWHYGIANVKWRLAGDGPEFITPPITVENGFGTGVGG